MCPKWGQIATKIFEERLIVLGHTRKCNQKTIGSVEFYEHVWDSDYLVIGSSAHLCHGMLLSLKVY